MRHHTFTIGDFERYRKPTRREKFPTEMDQVVPWDQSYVLIKPFYPKAGDDRPPIGPERMLRIYLLQHWFNLLVPGAKARVQQMHQTKKYNKRYFGIKAHIAVDDKTRQFHSVVATAANVHNSQALEDLLHGEETRVWGNSAYTRQTDVMYRAASYARDFTYKRDPQNRPLGNAAKPGNGTKSKVRARAEHVFAVFRRIFGFSKVRYRGLNNNVHAPLVFCALSNLHVARRRLRCRA